MTPEGKVKDRVKKILKELYRDVYIYMPVAIGYGRRAAPDFFVVIEGMMFGIETKANGNTPTELQEREMRALRRAGACVLVINEDNVESLPNLISDALNQHYITPHSKR